LPAAFAAASALLIVFFGNSRLPERESCPPPASTKTALAASPSIPSQFVSANARSGRSGAPGKIPASRSLQSAGVATP